MENTTPTIDRVLAPSRTVLFTHYWGINRQYGRGGVWPRRSMAAAEYGRGGVWPRRSMAAAEYGRGGVFQESFPWLITLCQSVLSQQYRKWLNLPSMAPHKLWKLRRPLTDNGWSFKKTAVFIINRSGITSRPVPRRTTWGDSAILPLLFAVTSPRRCQ